MKKRIFIVLLALCIILISAKIIVNKNWIPAKYAVKEDDFNHYAPYIIVQEVHYTGTFWVQVGDESGYFSSKAYLDIDLVNGDILPHMRMYNDDHVNKFLCKVEYVGKIEHPAYADEIDSYYIVEWYPIYPVLRDTILPQWLFPKNYMTEEELIHY